MEDCLFCKIVDDKIPSRRVYEDETSIAFLDIAPYHRGHTLIIPRRHVADGITDPGSWDEVAQAIVTVSSLLKDKLGATGVNVLSNAGSVSGQEIFHFHVHILPRYADRPGMSGLAQKEEDAAEDLDGLYASLMS